MKKSIYAVLFSSLVTCVPSYTPPPTLPSSINEISTPEDTKKWLENILTYQHDDQLYDTDDFWASCALTYQNRGGDCEDYAICAAAILQGDVDEGYIITLNSEDSAHAVFAYRTATGWGIISNDHNQFRLPLFDSLHEAVWDSLHTNYSRYSRYDYDGVDLANGTGDLESQFHFRGTYRLEK